MSRAKENAATAAALGMVLFEANLDMFERSVDKGLTDKSYSTRRVLENTAFSSSTSPAFSGSRSLCCCSQNMPYLARSLLLMFLSIAGGLVL